MYIKDIYKSTCSKHILHNSKIYLKFFQCPRSPLFIQYLHGIEKKERDPARNRIKSASLWENNRPGMSGKYDKLSSNFTRLDLVV